MRQVFDVKTTKREFLCGDKVLVLLPVSGAACLLVSVAPMSYRKDLMTLRM